MDPKILKMCQVVGSAGATNEFQQSFWIEFSLGLDLGNAPENQRWPSPRLLRAQDLNLPLDVKCQA